MKRIVSILVLIFTLSIINTYAGESKKNEETNALIEVMKSHEEVKGVDYYFFKGFMLNMARPSIKKTPIGGVAEQIEKLHIFAMKDVKAEQMKKFSKAAELAMAEYEKLVENKTEDKLSRIYIKKQGEEIISEMIVFAIDDEISLIYIIGDIPVSALEDIAARAAAQEEKKPIQ